MLSAFLVLVLTTGLAQLLISTYAQQFRHSKSTLNWLYAYHLLLFGVYYLYATFNSSDSKKYYSDVVNHFYGPNWWDYYGPGTPFIKFIAFPFVEYLGFSYEAMMLLFSFFGFVGFVYFYLFMVEQLRYRHKLLGFDFLLLLLFLPNMHFWSVSLGKGSIMFMGLGMLFYGLNDFTRRLLPLIIGGLIVFHVRSHVMLVILGGVLIASVSTSKGIKTWQKAIIVAAAIAVIAPVLGTFLEYAGLDEADSQGIDQWQQKRSGDLSYATSGVDLNSYSQPMKVFTFLFRPLFVDAPNALGLIISFENLFYLLIFIRCLSFSFLRYLMQSSWMVKIALVSFLGVSIALAQITGNTGIAIRQKAQVMYLFLFVFVAYADYAYQQKGKLLIGE